MLLCRAAGQSAATTLSNPCWGAGCERRYQVKTGRGHEKAKMAVGSWCHEDAMHRCPNVGEGDGEGEERRGGEERRRDGRRRQSFLRELFRMPSRRSLLTATPSVARHEICAPRSCDVKPPLRRRCVSHELRPPACLAYLPKANCVYAYISLPGLSPWFLMEKQASKRDVDDRSE
ncbi:hypothetical protein F5B21DRAFT_403879 [Xylaria acuta]|nr:hypothetical protein F5B21DRAFT_403879 [Xylaria acuta]